MKPDFHNGRKTEINSAVQQQWSRLGSGSPQHTSFWIPDFGEVPIISGVPAKLISVQSFFWR